MHNQPGSHPKVGIAKILNIASAGVLLLMKNAKLHKPKTLVSQETFITTGNFMFISIHLVCK